MHSTNPHSVLQSIGAGRGYIQHSAAADSRAADSSFGESTIELEPPSIRMFDAGCDRERNEIPSRDSVNRQISRSVPGDDILQSTIDSAKQIQQLANRLGEAKRELEFRHREFQHQEAAWQQDRASREEQLDRHQAQLQQQSAQVRLQQRYVMQLQDDIVKSYEVSKQSISNLVSQAPEELGDQLIRELKMLQREIGERFDYVARRWAHLHRILQDQQERRIAEESIDDRVNWHS